MADNVTTVWKFLRGKGLTPAQAAGVIGSMQGESGQGLDPAAENPGPDHALGIAQWLGSRKNAAVLSKQLGPQLNHLWHELQTSESKALASLKKARTPQEAAIAWQRDFERGAPFEQKYDQRVANARRVLQRMHGVPGSADNVASGPMSDRVNGQNSANARIAKAMGLLDAGASSLLSSPGTAAVSVDTPGNRLNALRTFQRTGDTLGFAQKISSLRAQDVAATPADTTTTSLLSDALGGGTPTGATGDHSAPSVGGAKGGHDAHGTVDFEGKKVAAWIAPALQYARQRGWKGSVNSGFRSFADQQRIYNSGVRPAARPGTSNHEGADFPRGAIDVSDAQTLSRILQRSPYAKKLIYAGPKDPVHFSHPHGGSY